MDKKRSVIITFLVIILFFSIKLQINAADAAESGKPVTIKVAFYQLDGFFEYDKNGNQCGYGVDYLNELKKYANIEWEYVDVDSWEKIGDMMKNGEADVRMPVSESVQPSEIYNYTTEDILTTYHAIMTLDSNDKFYYEDYDAISKMKLAVTENLVAKTGISDYLTSLGVIDNLVYYDNYNECKEALNLGYVDGLLSNIMDCTDDMKILDKFAVTKNYITTLKSSPYYTLINTAMTELELENPSFQTQLYQKYYPKRIIEPFTKEEIEYIKKTQVLRIAVYTDRKPVSYYDEKTGTYKGIAIDIANELSEKIGIKFEYVPAATDKIQDMLNDTDLVMPVTAGHNSNKYFATSNILESEIIMAIRSGDKQPCYGAKVGTLISTEGITDAIQKRSNFEIIQYKTNKEALKALENGEIEAFVNSSYVINWLLENPQYYDLSVLHYQGFSLEYEISGRRENSILQSILNKAISAISDDDKDTIIKENTNFSMDDLSNIDKLYAYKTEIIMSVIVIFIIVCAAILYNCSRTRYIRQIEEKSQEQEKANQAKSNFLSRMSHDMRTPMNAIIGMSYLGSKSNSIVELKDYHQKINQSGKYLLCLINDTLDMSRIDNGKMELHLEPYYVTEFVNAIKVMFSEKVKDKNIHFSVIINEKYDKALMFDKLRLQQIFVNLINNAIKFSYKDGNVEFLIRIDEVTDKSVKLTFIVRDQGCGMTKKFQKKMYEPFEQGDQSTGDSETGTGLGLSIVKQLVHLMGGTISCISEPEKGTEFTVKLEGALYNGELEVLQEHAEKKDICSLQGKRVLLCEDHPLNVQIAVKLLEKEGMLVETAQNGQIGVEKFKNSSEGYYQIILMDIRMPVMNGLEATRIIRQINRSDADKIPIIAMTANAFDEDVKKSLDAGMNAHLAKPIDADSFYSTIRHYCS